MPMIGRYEVVRELARGGMGAVLHARSPEGRDVAIKVVLNAGARDALARFERERRLLASVGEGFVPILDAGEDRSGPFLVMPLVTGGTLRDRLEKGALPIADALSLLGTLARAIGRAHAKGIVHRDLKPENVLFTDSGEPLIADLGLAKHFRHDVPGASQSVALSQTGEFKGTLGYMAPEQTGKAREAGPPADVFALGAILFECLAGEAPFEGRTASEVLAKVASGSSPSVRSLRGDAPRWLARVIDRALRREPERRYPDGAALALALEQGPALDRRRRLLASIGSIATVAALAASYALVRAPRSEPRAAPSPAPAASAATPAASGTPRPPSSGRPAWFDALPEAERPKLPRGIVCTEEPRVYKNVKDGSELVYIPGGAFTMGTGSDETLFPHEVTLSPYFLGRYEVTVTQFEQFVAATKHRTLCEEEGSAVLAIQYDANPANPTVAGASFRLPDGRATARPTEPATQLTWDDARAYCEWAGLELPTEAQWEFAAGWDAKAKRARRYPWGDEEPAKEYAASRTRRANLMDEQFKARFPLELNAYYGYDDGYAVAAPVGSFPLGATLTGCFDMGGNVREWMRDDYDIAFYKRSPAKDPVCALPRDEQGVVSMHVVRGSSFATSTVYSGTTYRASSPTSFHSWDLGLRVALDAR